LGSHLNFLAYEYFGEGQTFWHLIVSDPMFYPFTIGWLIVIVAIWLWVGTIGRRAGAVGFKSRWFAYPIWFVIFFALTFLGIRGRTGLSPIGWAVAYWSDNQFINQLGLNGLYTLGRATIEEGNDPRLSYLPESERFPFVPLSEGIDSIQAMLGQPNDTWLEPGKSLRRLTSQPPAPWGFNANVVIVVMESWTAKLTGSLGCPRNLTPRFDSLSSHGILFTDFYANGVRSNYGLGAILCSFPSLPGRSIMTRYNAAHPFVAISEILKQRGYYNIFAYGGDIEFDNMRGFLTTKGYDITLDDAYFGKEHVFAKWGVPDHVVFSRLVTMIDTLPRPFNLTVFTLSNHEPFDLPDSGVQRYSDNSNTSRLYNVQLYADKAIGDFVDEFRSHQAFDSTVFVFVSDHCKRGGDRFLLDPFGFQIPMLIYAPKLVGDSALRVHTVGGQIDVIPTLMSVLGGEYRHESWGRNLLDAADSGFAFVNDANDAAIIISRLIFRDNFNARSSLLDRAADTTHDTDISAQNDSAADAMKRRLRIFFQVADQLSTPRPSGPNQ
jgi:phosphoglycerol transferase MdoB-like AlkP superfamily enzyme